MTAPKLTKARRRVLENIEAGRPWNHGGGNGMGGAARRMLIAMSIERLVEIDCRPYRITDAGRVVLKDGA